MTEYVQAPEEAEAAQAPAAAPEFAAPPAMSGILVAADPAARARAFSGLGNAYVQRMARATPRVDPETLRIARVAETARAGGQHADAYAAGRALARTRLLQRGPPDTAPPPTGANDVVEQLRKELSDPNKVPDREKLFGIALANKDRWDELNTAYKGDGPYTLEQHLKLRLRKGDVVRIRAYMKQGSLRLADKIYLACEDGVGTDEETLFRLLPDAHAPASRAVIENIFTQEYKDDLGATAGTLPNQQSSVLAGVLESELSDWELDKAKALVAYGELRPADEARIAVNRMGTDTNLLWAALKRAKDPKVVKEEYLNSYNEELLTRLDSELSLEDWKRAKAALEGTLTARRKIEIACEGLGTNLPLIWEALENATPKEREELKADFHNKQSEFFQLVDDDLSTGDLKRMEALLGGGGSALEKMKQAGGDDNDSILDVLRKASAADLKLYGDAYKDQASDFNTYVTNNVFARNRGDVITTILYGTPNARLRQAIGWFSDDEDYVFHTLDLIRGDEAAKKTVRDDKALMDLLEDDLSTTDFRKVETMLQSADASIDERAKQLDKQVKDERSTFVDIFSTSGDALDDETRELHDRLKALPPDQRSPEDVKALERKLAASKGALEAYQKTRDEIQEVAATIVTTAVGIIVGILTAGAGAAAIATMALEQLARQVATAVLAQAVAKVATLKAIKGDQFDIFGADGAIAFGVGVVDGVTSVLGPAAVQNAINPAFKAAASEAAKEAAEKAFATTLANRVLAKTIEGGASGGASAVFESSANEKNWSGGFTAAATKIGGDTGKGMLIGGATAVGMELGGSGIKAVRGHGAGTGEGHGTTGGDEGGGGHAAAEPHAPPDAAVKARNAEFDTVKSGEPIRAGDEAHTVQLDVEADEIVVKICSDCEKLRTKIERVIGDPEVAKNAELKGQLDKLHKRAGRLERDVNNGRISKEDAQIECDSITKEIQALGDKHGALVAPVLGIPRGLTGAEQLAQFAGLVDQHLGGLSDHYTAFIGGSAVTGKSFQTGKPFGPHSDIDLGIVSADLFNVAAGAPGADIRGNGTYTGPNPIPDILDPLRADLSKLAGGREVNVVIYKNRATAQTRNPDTIDVK